MFDLGDPVPLSVSVYDTANVLANATAVVCTITLPDGTTVTPAVTNASTGVYTTTYTPTLPGRHGVRWVATGTNASSYTDAFDTDEAAPTGIVSLAEVKAHLNMTSTANDEELRRYIDAATDFIEYRIGAVVRRSIIKTVNPAGDGRLYLPDPVISLTTITDAYGYGATYSVANYVGDASGVVRGVAYSSTFSYPVTVTYVGGRAIVPALIRQAALDYVAWRWESQRGPTPLPLPGGEFEVQAAATVPYKILQALEPYMTPVVA